MKQISTNLVPKRPFSEIMLVVQIIFIFKLYADLHTDSLNYLDVAILVDVIYFWWLAAPKL